MMLVQKPPNFPISLPQSPPFHHRRHPSAPPAVVVQPTHTPGLLSLSKPAPVRHQPPQRSPVPARQQTTTPNRGRQTKDGKDNKTPQARSPSRKHVHRQPSPQQSDPFLVSPKPSGKLARRRQQQPQQPQTPVAVPVQSPTPVPIPASRPPLKKPISRSVPIPRSSRPKGSPRTAARTTASDATATLALLPAFPVCDDMTDAGDLSDAEPAATLSRTRRRPANPFGPAPAAPTTTRQPTLGPTPVKRTHKRAPSEGTLRGDTGVFNMSSDDDSYSSESTSTHDVRLLFEGLLVRGVSGTTKPAHVAPQYKTPPPFHSPSYGPATYNVAYSPSPPARRTHTRRNTHTQTLSYVSSLGTYSEYEHDLSPLPTPASAPFSAATFPRGSRTPPNSNFGTTASIFGGAPKTPIGQTANAMRERQYEALAAAQMQQLQQGQSGYFASSMFQNSPSPEELPDPLFV